MKDLLEGGLMETMDHWWMEGIYIIWITSKFQILDILHSGGSKGAELIGVVFWKIQFDIGDILSSQGVVTHTRGGNFAQASINTNGWLCISYGRRHLR